MPSDSNNIFGFFDEFEASEGESQPLPIELIQEPIEISSTRYNSAGRFSVENPYLYGKCLSEKNYKHSPSTAT